jgi:hypothetical protein
VREASLRNSLSHHLIWARPGIVSAEDGRFWRGMTAHVPISPESLPQSGLFPRGKRGHAAP